MKKSIVTLGILAIVLSVVAFVGNTGRVSAQSSAPVITSVSPTSGPAGTVVTLTGTNFINSAAPDSAILHFDSVGGTGNDITGFGSRTSTSLTFTVPNIAYATHTLYLETTDDLAGGGGVSNGVNFQVTPPGSTPGGSWTQSAGGQVTGWGWTSNTGWISFNCSDTNSCGQSNYSVQVDSSGNMTGYAWSSNIGWIKFGGLSDFPSGSGTAASNAALNLTTGQVTGWARACAGTISGDCSASGVTFTTGAMTYDPQDDRFYQDITVTNSSSETLSGVRVIVQSLTTGSGGAGASYYRYSGIDSGTGKYYFQHNYPISSGQSVRIRAQYNDSARVAPSATYSSVSPVTAVSEPAIPAGSTQITLSQHLFSSPRYIVQFPTTVGQQYAVQYSDNGGATWHTAFGTNESVKMIDGDGTTLQFIDSGSPQTMSPPTSSRQHRVYQLPAGSYPGTGGGNGTYSVSGGSAASRTDGWDGWISLSGSNYISPTANGTGGVTMNPVTGAFNGFAWGADVNGWISFNTVTCPGCATGGESGNCLANGGTSNINLPASGGTVTYSFNVTSGTAHSYSWSGAVSGSGSTVSRNYTSADSASPYNEQVMINGNTSPFLCPSVSVIPAQVGSLDLSIGRSAQTANQKYLKLVRGNLFGLSWSNSLDPQVYTCSALLSGPPGGNWSAWSSADISIDGSLGSLPTSPASSYPLGPYVFSISCKDANNVPATGSPASVTLNIVSSSVIEF